MRAKLLTAAAILAVVGLAVLGASIVMKRGPKPEEVPSVDPPEVYQLSTVGATYVGTPSCIPCHESQHRDWLGSHHDLAMQEATDATVLGDFDDATFEKDGVTSRFFERDGKFFVNTDGPDGTMRDYEILYTFGVDPLQQYLVEIDDSGRLQALSLCWDTRHANLDGQRWFHLYPDERIPFDDELHWTKSSQNWNYACAECHSTNLQKNYDPGRDRFDTTWSEIDVGCEACHGPASVHVAWAQSEAARDETRYPEGYGLVHRLADTDGGQWLMNLETGKAARTVTRTSQSQLETCARCHSRRSQMTTDYAHGGPLLDTHRLRVLDEGLYYADGQIRDEVYVYGSFVQSVMHHHGVTCSDCHDPHGLQLHSPGNTVCYKCHQPEVYDTPRHHFHPPGPGAQCVECHMPERTYMVVDPRRDHSIRVPRPDLTGPLGAPDACTTCHRDQSPEWAADAIVRWYGPERATPSHFGQALHAGRRGSPGAETALITLAMDGEQPGIARASALSLLRGYPSEGTLVAIETGLRDDDPLVRLQALDALEIASPEQRWRLAGPLLDDPVRTVRAEAGRILAPVPPNMLGSQQRQKLQAAFDEYVACQAASAERPESHLNVGLINLMAGRRDAAETAYRTALRIDPGFVPATVNLADLMREQGRDDEGEAILRAALEIAPNAAAVHHSLGLLLIRQQRIADAIEALRRGASLAPESAQYSFAYALALDAVGQTPDAIRVLTEALQRHAYDRDLLGALVSMHRQTGNQAAADGYAQRLAELDQSR